MPQYPIWILPQKDADTDTDPATITWRSRRIIWDTKRGFIRVGDGVTPGGRVFRPGDLMHRQVTFAAGNTTYQVTDTDQLIAVNASAVAGEIVFPVGLGSASVSQQVTIMKSDATATPVVIAVTAGGTPLAVLLNQHDHVHVWSDGTNLQIAG